MGVMSSLSSELPEAATPAATTAATTASTTAATTTAIAAVSTATTTAAAVAASGAASDGVSARGAALVSLEGLAAQLEGEARAHADLYLAALRKVLAPLFRRMMTFFF